MYAYWTGAQNKGVSSLYNIHIDVMVYSLINIYCPAGLQCTKMWTHIIFDGIEMFSFACWFTYHFTNTITPSRLKWKMEQSNSTERNKLPQQKLKTNFFSLLLVVSFVLAHFACLQYEFPSVELGGGYRIAFFPFFRVYGKMMECWLQTHTHTVSHLSPGCRRFTHAWLLSVVFSPQSVHNSEHFAFH